MIISCTAKVLGLLGISGLRRTLHRAPAYIYPIDLVRRRLDAGQPPVVPYET